MNAPDKVTLPTSTSNPMPKVFPKKDIVRQRVVVREPATPPKTLQAAGSSRATEPIEGTRLNSRKGRVSITSRPVSNERPQEGNAVNIARVSPIGGSPTVHFEYIAPQAKAVFVAGSFNEWNPAAAALARSAQGKWTVDLALSPGRYEYLFVVELEMRDREPILIETLGPGRELGWSWILPPQHYEHFSATALEATDAIFFYGARLREECEHNRDFGYEMMKRMAVVMLHRIQAATKLLLEAPAK